jgi:hypothetical protein
MTNTPSGPTGMWCAAPTVPTVVNDLASNHRRGRFDAVNVVYAMSVDTLGRPRRWRSPCTRAASTSVGDRHVWGRRGNPEGPTTV